MPIITRKERIELVRPQICDSRIVDTADLLKRVRRQYPGNADKKTKAYIASLPDKMPFGEFWIAMENMAYRNWVGDTCNICKEWSIRTLNVTPDWSDYSAGNVCLECLRVAVSLLSERQKITDFCEKYLESVK